jgi:hypothetical protein
VRWATRSRPHVDRAACAWLIRRFIDADAEFVFVDDPDDVPAEATPFDMPGAELSHHGGACSFEAFLARYELDDPALAGIARIVHEADLDDERYDAPAAPGLDAIISGLALEHDDHGVLAQAAPVFDALYARELARTSLRDP